MFVLINTTSSELPWFRNSSPGVTESLRVCSFINDFSLFIRVTYLFSLLGLYLSCPRHMNVPHALMSDIHYHSCFIQPNNRNCSNKRTLIFLLLFICLFMCCCCIFFFFFLFFFFFFFLGGGGGGVKCYINLSFPASPVVQISLFIWIHHVCIKDSVDPDQLASDETS